jgi:hypothetical protein
MLNSKLNFKIVFIIICSLSMSHGFSGLFARYTMVSPMLQSWRVQANPNYSQFSTLIYSQVPIKSDVSLTLRIAQANIGGQVAKLNGITDLQSMVSYYLRGSNTTLNFGLNLPSGTKNLSQEQFSTSSIISRNVFSLQVPNFSQGLNISAGATRVFIVSETTVLGVGASYMIKGKYKPLEILDDYDPGNEFLMTMGADFRLNSSSSISSDLVLTWYGTDNLAGEKIFSPGNKIVLSTRYRKYLRFNDLSIHMLIRLRGKSDLAVDENFVTEDQKTLPNQLEFYGRYSSYFNRRLTLVYLAEMRFHQVTPNPFSGVRLFGLGFQPKTKISPRVYLFGSLRYRFGQIKNGYRIRGYEIGIGAEFGF